MVIEGDDFRLTPVKDSCRLFDLDLLYVVNKGKDSERKEFKNAAYGVTLESAIKYIASYKVAQNHDDTIDLKTYLKEYKEIARDIIKLCEILSIY